VEFDSKFDEEFDSDYRIIEDKKQFDLLVNQIRDTQSKRFLFSIKKELSKKDDTSYLDSFYYYVSSYTDDTGSVRPNADEIHRILSNNNLLSPPYYIKSSPVIPYPHGTYSFIVWKRLKADHPKVFEEILDMIRAEENYTLSNSININREYPTNPSEPMMIKIARKLNGIKYKMQRKKYLKNSLQKKDIRV